MNNKLSNKMKDFNNEVYIKTATIVNPNTNFFTSYSKILGGKDNSILLK